METLQTTNPCKFCDKGHDRNPGGYYDAKYCESNWIRDRLKDPKITGQERKVLVRQLQLAEYVGD
jgi:hypothetical protein